MYNPILDYQRNQYIAQQAMAQNQMQQMHQPTFNPYPQPQQPQYFVRNMGYDEAKAFPADPGVIYLFPDVSNGRIYLKRFNSDNGKSEIYIYTPSQEGEVVVENDPMKLIGKRLDNIDERIGGLYESISKLSNNAKHDEESHRNDATINPSKDAETRPSKIQSNSRDA